jgi:hypothetical protein
MEICEYVRGYKNTFLSQFSLEYLHGKDKNGAAMVT